MQIEIFLLATGDANRDLLASTGKGSLEREVGKSKAGRIELRLPKQIGNVCWACSTPVSPTEVSEDVRFALHFCMIGVVLKTICAIVLTGECVRLYDSGS